MTKFKTILLLTIIPLTFSFKDTKNTVEFVYPAFEDKTITLQTNEPLKFKKEVRGEGLYFLSKNKPKEITCSLLFFKLNEEEKMMFVDLPKAMMGIDSSIFSPALPLTYFKNYSRLKDFEENQMEWGKIDDDFMYRQADIVSIEGQIINQKHMYAYAMLTSDIFVNIHLSKVNCSKSDSVEMVNILNSIKLNHE